MADEQALAYSRNPIGLAISVVPSFSVWALQAATSYILVEKACSSPGVETAIHLINGVALILLVVFAVAAYKRYKASSRESKEAEIDAWPPERWMPAAAFVLASAFALVTLAQAIPQFILGRCQ